MSRTFQDILLVALMTIGPIIAIVLSLAGNYPLALIAALASTIPFIIHLSMHIEEYEEVFDDRPRSRPHTHHRHNHHAALAARDG